MNVWNFTIFGFNPFSSGTFYVILEAFWHDIIKLFLTFLSKGKARHNAYHFVGNFLQMIFYDCLDTQPLTLLVKIEVKGQLSAKFYGIFWYFFIFKLNIKYDVCWNRKFGIYPQKSIILYYMKHINFFFNSAYNYLKGVAKQRRIL